MQTLSIKKPFDSHIHLRRGAVLRAVTPHTTKRFSSGIIMPNTEPPIETTAQAAEYKKEILEALQHSNVLQNVRTSFEPLMTFYLTKNLTPGEIEKGWVGEYVGHSEAADARRGESGARDVLNNTMSATQRIRNEADATYQGQTKVFAVKSYPFGATTNSQWGYRSILEADEVLKKMEEVGMPLLLHGEVHLNEHDEEEDPYDGEAMFVADILPRLLDAYPKLKVSLEHMSSSEAIDFMEKNGAEGSLVTTVTPHHLMYDRRQAFSGGYRALLHCKPLVKKREDRERLRDMAKKGLPFVSAGTDSAPHPENKKFSSCCAFGVFNAPVAVEMYTQVFDELGCLDKLESFLSLNGPRFFGVEPSKETMTLMKKDWQVEKPVITEEGAKIWPVAHKVHGLGNEIIHWQIKE